MPLATGTSAARNVTLYPWFKFCQSLIFWQAIWFLYFQNTLSAAEAILLYAIYDVGTTVLEVPSGYMSDRLGRRRTLIASAIAGIFGATLLATGDSFAVFAMAQVLLGASMAFASGTDNALLYESLDACGRGEEIERHELRAWRFTFCALALSAITGGLMATWSEVWPFIAGGVAFAAVLAITLRFAEPPHRPDASTEDSGASLKAALVQPVLVWLFALSVVMYVFSHIPFVFGQPFILEALRDQGWQGEAPLVSGVVSAAMMVLSVIASLVAWRLRRRLGLAAILLFAFGLQIAISGMLALTNEAIAILLLFLRMVPDALSKPFILARIQPMLASGSRATYLSLQSFCGRLIFAGTLFLASSLTAGAGEMPYPIIQQVLGWYVLGGLLCLAALGLAATRVRIDVER